jgi:hypothetical protein
MRALDTAVDGNFARNHSVSRMTNITQVPHKDELDVDQCRAGAPGEE